MAQQQSRLEQAIIEDTIHRGDPTMHAELLHVTEGILTTAKRRGWTGGPMSELEQCLYEADQFEARAQELRAALGLMGEGGDGDAAAASEEADAEEQAEQAQAAAVEEGQAMEEGEQEEGGAEDEGEGILGSVRSFLPRFLGGRGAHKGARETLRLARRYETMAACLRTQAELDLAFWKTSGQYVRPEELSLLYLARRIILSEGEKDRFVAAHPELDRHDDISQELEDISKRLLRYRTLFSIRTGGRWFQAWSEDGLQVCSDARFPASKPNAFHVQCFFDGTVTEADLQDSTEYLRVHEAEKRARWQGKQAVSAIASGVTAPFRLILWPFSSAAKAQPQEPAAEGSSTTALAMSDEGKSAAIIRFSLLHLLSKVTGTVTGTIKAILFWGDEEEEEEEEGQRAEQQEQQQEQQQPMAKHAAADMGIPSSEAEESV